MQQYFGMSESRARAFVIASALISGMLLLFSGPMFVHADTSVSVMDNSFSPQTITITPGDTVTWTNNGSMNHTVTADDGSFTSGTLAPNGTFTHTFTTAGSFPYHCQFHGGPGGVGMSGVVIVSGSASSTSSSTSTTSNSTSTSGTSSSTTPTNMGTSTVNATSTTDMNGMGSSTASTTPTGTGTTTATSTSGGSTSTSGTGTSTPSGSITIGTSTGTSTLGNIDSLNIRIGQLEAFIKQLQLQILIIFQNNGIPFPHGNLGGGNEMTSTLGAAVYADEYAVSPGATVQFNGTGFGANEDVSIMANGSMLGTAHTDADGNFTISGNASMNPGDTTYWFTGENSGQRDSVMITVVTGNE